MNPLNKRSIAIAGIFLIVVGSVFLIFGIWYVHVYGISIETPEDPRHLMDGGIFSLIATSCSLLVLGIIFLLWSYRLPKQSKKQWNACRVNSFPANPLEKTCYRQ